MNIILSILMIAEVTTALLLIAIILMQRSKSGGGLGALAGGQTEEVFGSSASSILTKTTIALSIIFFILTLSLAVLQGNALKDKNTSVVDSVLAETELTDESEQPEPIEKLTGVNEVEVVPKSDDVQVPTETETSE